MNELFLGENKHTRAHKGKKTQWTTTDAVDWKARVVCEECNNGWMSNLESKHAKPVLTPLITGEALNIPITQQEGRSIALWIFKTAVIIDEASHRKNPWFSQRIKDSLRLHGTMPASVRMWICGAAGLRGRINFRSIYSAADFDPPYPVSAYISTGSIGHFVFQFASIKQIGNRELYPIPGFGQIAMPIWPRIYRGLKWPFPVNLNGQADFDKFVDRWNRFGYIPSLVR